MRRRGDEAEDWDGQSRRRPAPYGSHTRRVHLPDAVPAVPLPEWAVGPASGRTLPQLKPHHRKTGERLIVKCVLQKLFHFFLELSGVRRVRFLLLWQGCALQRGSPKGRRFRQRESAPPRRRGRASLAKPSFRALRSECSDNRDISIEKAPAFPGRGGACCLESRFWAAASAKNVFFLLLSLFAGSYYRKNLQSRMFIFACMSGR